MYVAVIPNRGSPPAILLRESYREAGKTKNRTLANLSRWPAERIEQLRAVLRGDQLLPAAEAVEIVRALPHGHVLAALGTARRIALDAVLPRRAPQRRRDLALALIIARLPEPAAKLATARTLDPATASHSPGELVALGRLAREQALGPAGLDWITALRAPAIKQLAAEGGPLQPSLFDDRDMAEITSPDYLGERLVVCKTPLLAEERARKRAELLAATEKELARIAARVQRARSPLRGAAAIGQAVGAVLGRRHMATHFQVNITDDTFRFAQNPLRIAPAAALA